jgi:hypothetical protein
LGATGKPVLPRGGRIAIMSHRRALVASLVVVGLLMAREARAEDPPTRWYGWQTLAVYGGDVALALALQHVNNRSPFLDRIAFGTFIGALAFGGAAVHAAHGRWTAAAGSVGLEAAFPGMVGLVAWGSCSGDRFCPIYASLFGVLAWGVGATIDIAVLAHEPTAPPAPSAPQRSTGGPRVVAPLRVGFRF